MLAHAIKFSFGDERNHRQITVERRSYVDDTESWAICNMGQVLAKNGKWEYEPFPSSRSKTFLKRCRWNNRDKAIEVARAALLILEAEAKAFAVMHRGRGLIDFDPEQK